MTEYFGHHAIPVESELGPAWSEPGLIDMAGAEMFSPVNREIVGHFIGELVTPGADILETEAGTGHLGSLMPSTHLANYRQTDRNPRYVALAAAKNPKLAFETADVYDLEALLSDDTPRFDAVVAMDLLDILDDVPTAAEQIAAVLNPGGKFLHFHNRRPSMSILSRSLRQFGHIFPSLDEDGGLKRFQIVSTAEYAAKRDRLTHPKASDAVAKNPDLLDWFCEHEEALFRSVALDIRSHFPEGKPTISFVDIMHKAASSALEGAGMSVDFAGLALSEKVTSRKWVASLLKSSGMAKDVNVVTKQPGGILFDTATLPNGQVLIRNYLSVLRATKD